jgi:hypothetical protein
LFPARDELLDKLPVEINDLLPLLLDAADTIYRGHDIYVTRSICYRGRSYLAVLLVVTCRDCGKDVKQRDIDLSH